jgi:hypothetical protein
MNNTHKLFNLIKLSGGAPDIINLNSMIDGDNSSTTSTSNYTESYLNGLNTTEQDDIGDDTLLKKTNDISKIDDMFPLTNLSEKGVKHTIVTRSEPIFLSSTENKMVIPSGTLYKKSYDSQLGKINSHLDKINKEIYALEKKLF